MNDCQQTSCLIPFYNEGKRLDAVLSEVVKIKNISEIICIDDGSKESISEEILIKFPNIIFHRLEKNLGKTGAIREGLKLVSNNLVLLLDADLRNLDYKEIEQAVDGIQQDERIDMLILRRTKAPFIIRLVRGDVLVTGERIIKRHHLQDILNTQIKGYQLESAINEYMFKKNVYWSPHSGINTHKPLKMNLACALKRDAATFADMFTGAGFFTYIKHILFFGRKQLNAKDNFDNR